MTRDPWNRLTTLDDGTVHLYRIESPLFKYSKLLRKGAGAGGLVFGGYSIAFDAINPDVSKEAVIIESVGHALSFGASIYVASKYGGMAGGPKGALAGAGVGLAYAVGVSSIYYTDKYVVPVIDTQTHRIRTEMHLFEQRYKPRVR